jgi:hypothetical protein
MAGQRWLWLLAAVLGALAVLAIVNRAWAVLGWLGICAGLGALIATIGYRSQRPR